MMITNLLARSKAKDRGAGVPATDRPDRDPRPARDQPPTSNRLLLALQGGGSFGAFTWGVLDRLLEDGRIEFDSVSGASAGALNAVLMASGMAAGGPERARETLNGFWRHATERANSGLLATLLGGIGRSVAFDMSTRIVSPYQYNPLGLNPMRQALVGTVDFDALRENSPFRLLVAATRVSDGSLRLFREHELTLDVVLASTCLPLLHHAPEIDGELYWDGGYVANPPLLPLIEESTTHQVLLVQLIPMEVEEHPTTSPRILSRLGQITFNTPLMHDIESIATMKRLADQTGNEGPLATKLSRLRIDRIAAEEWVDDLRRDNPLTLDRSFVDRMFERGRAAGAAWLTAHRGEDETVLTASFGEH